MRVKSNFLEITLKYLPFIKIIRKEGGTSNNSFNLKSFSKFGTFPMVGSYIEETFSDINTIYTNVPNFVNETLNSF